MKRVLVHHNVKPETLKLKKKIESILLSSGNMVVSKNPDLVLVIGGDGTMLSAIRKYQDSGVPFLGIDLGTLGFLNTIMPDQLQDLVEVLNGGNFKTAKYPLLTVKIRTINGENLERYAFNEVLIKHLEPRLMEAKVCFNGKPFNYFTGDGFILSTPIGATGYAIWTGGAVMHSDLDVFQITPLTPNDNSVNRPMSSSMILPSDTVVDIDVIKAKRRKVIVACDGQNSSNHFIEKIQICMEHEKKIEIIRKDSFDYFDLFKRKIIDKNIRRQIN